MVSSEQETEARERGLIRERKTPQKETLTEKSQEWNISKFLELLRKNVYVEERIGMWAKMHESKQNMVLYVCVCVYIYTHTHIYAYICKLV